MKRAGLVWIAVGIVLVTGCRRSHRQAESSSSAAAPVAPPSPSSQGLPAASQAAATPPPPIDAGSGPQLLDFLALAKEKTFTSLKEARQQKDSVVKLALENQGISSLPWLSQFPKLQVLDLSHNGITDVSGIGQLKRLQRLDLSDNPLKRPPDLSALTELEELDLSRTLVATLPFEVGRLSKLRTLRIGTERLKRLPNELTDATALTTLSLKGCSQLSHLPTDIGRLNQLALLEIGGTGIGEEEVKRVQALLPKVQIIGGGASGALEAQPTSAEDDSSSQLPCAEVLQKGWSAFIGPIAEKQGELSAGSPLATAVEHFKECAAQQVEPTRASLDADASGQLSRVARALESFENARFDLAEVGLGQGEEKLEPERLVAQAARAAVESEMVRAVRQTGEAQPVADNPAQERIQAALKRLSEQSPNGAEEEYQASLNNLQERADSLLQMLEDASPAFQTAVTNRMEEVLRPIHLRARSTLEPAEPNAPESGEPPP